MPLPRPGSPAALGVLPAAAKRGYLLAGVSQDTLHWSYRDPSTNGLTGFDVEMLDQIAAAMFGTSAHHITFVVVPNKDRAKAVHDGQVDIVAETMTITCGREHDPKLPVDFSSVYYAAEQKVLVPTGSKIRTIADLAGKRVCASENSTSILRLAYLSVHPAVVPWQVANQSDCLVLLQQGRVDAISTDDTILAGFEAQDPQVTMLGGPPLEHEPYGMAISQTNPALTRFVNAVLARERADGTWQRLYETWLCPHGAFTCTAPAPPTASYRS
jgi:polar amino acid transport system substrate-binding protein